MFTANGQNEEQLSNAASLTPAARSFQLDKCQIHLQSINIRFLSDR